MLAQLPLLALLAGTALASPIKRDSILPPLDPSTTVIPDSTGIVGHRLRLQDRLDLCLVPRWGYDTPGSGLAISWCSSDPQSAQDPESQQLWMVDSPEGDGPAEGLIRYTKDQELCIQGGSEDGSGLSLEYCDESNQDQIWTREYTAGGGVDGDDGPSKMWIRLVGSDQCIDVNTSYDLSSNKPFNVKYDVQTWHCHPRDTADDNQWFAIY
ncbi:hypothetical protein IAU60_006828 [Kwoniella sp. DSM 27419]